MQPIHHAQNRAIELLQAQRDHAKTEARIRARVDAEIAARAEQDRVRRANERAIADEALSISNADDYGDN
jgi:hypothetical protein